MAFVNFDLKSSARVLSRLLVVRDFKHALIFRRISPGWSSDGGQALKTSLTFVDILIASSRVTGIILPVSQITLTLTRGGGLLRLSKRTYILEPVSLLVETRNP